MNTTSLKTKLLVATAGCLILAVSLAELTSSILHYRFLKNAVQSKLVSVASAVAAHVDVTLHEKLRSPKDMKRKDYKAAVTTLNGVLKNDPSIRFIYTLRREQNKDSETDGKFTYRFVLDGGSAKAPPGTDNEDFSKIGDLYETPLTMEARLAFRSGRVIADSKITKDKWGYTISGYAPLKDGEGKVVALLGVDMSADELNETLSTIFLIALGSAAGAGLLAFLLANALNRALMQPLDLLRRAAERVSHGVLNEPIESQRRDEFAFVFGTFNRMMTSIAGTREALIEKSRTDASLKLAASVQERLFDWQSIIRPDVVVSHFVQMADDTGGDWAHYYLAQDRYLYLICADVVGHGIASAMVAAAVAGSFESVKIDLDAGTPSLTWILDRMHRACAAAGRGDFPMTVLLVRLDLATGDLRFINAGHPPARIAEPASRADIAAGHPRRMRALKAGGEYIGSSTKPEFVEYGDQLKHGDLLILYSDGLVERRDVSGRAFGSGRLARLLAREVATVPQEVCFRILRKIEDFCGGTKPDDDISLIVVRYAGGAQTVKPAKPALPVPPSAGEAA